MLNDEAKSVIDNQRDKHPTHVFFKDDKTPVSNILSSAWRKARLEAAIELIKKSNECEFLDIIFVSNKNEKVIDIIFKRKNDTESMKRRYKLDDLNRERLSRNLKELDVTNRDAGRTVYITGLKQFIEIEWPDFNSFANVRVHDLKHSFATRLRSAGVSLETRKVLLGHANGDITTHYSAPQIDELINAANLVSNLESGKNPAMTFVKKKKA